MNREGNPTRSQNSRSTPCVPYGASGTTRVVKVRTNKAIQLAPEDARNMIHSHFSFMQLSTQTASSTQAKRSME